MSEDGKRETENNTDAEDKAERPAQAAALHEDWGKGEQVPQDTTHDTRWDTEEHSDAPGPTGTG